MEKNTEKELMERLDKCTALLNDYKRDNLKPNYNGDHK